MSWATSAISAMVDREVRLNWKWVSTWLATSSISSWCRNRCFMFTILHIVIHKSSLIIINQNRAHQRILYERFLTGITSKKIHSQNLVFPIKIDIKKSTSIFFKENSDILGSLGYKIDLKKNQAIIHGAPQGFSQNQIKDSIENFLDFNNNEVDINSLSQADFIAKNLAKSLSIKSGVILKIEEQKVLVDDLFACKENLLCPFNRKIFITFDQKEIQKKIN